MQHLGLSLEYPQGAGPFAAMDPVWLSLLPIPLHYRAGSGEKLLPS